MAQLGFNFNADDHEDFGARTVLPEGNHKVIIVNSSISSNKNKDGQNLTIEFSVQDQTGRFQGVVLKDYLAVINKNEIAQKIARQKLATITRCAGLNGVLNDSAQLHGRPIILRVDVKDDEYEGKKFKKNTIIGYSKVGSNPETTQNTNTQSTPW